MSPDERAPAADAPPPITRWVAAIVAAKLALHLAVLATTEFGVHRDEFLYFSMGQHLRFWRMDFPPAIAILANVSRALFGDSLAAVRVLPAIEGSILVVLAAYIARDLGGRRFAQLLAAGCVATGALFLRASTLFQPVVLDQLWWTLALYALVRLCRRESLRGWVMLGIALGLGLLTKFSILFLGFALLVALLVTERRRWLATPGPWVAAAIAFALGAPSIVGQVALDYPVVGQMRDLQGDQLSHVTWSAFVTAQPLMVGPVPFALAVAGAAALVLRRSWRAYAVVGWTCIAAFALLFLLRGKAYYIGPIYPALLAAGSVLVEQVRGRWAMATRAVVIAGTLLFAAVGLPLGVPVLPKEAIAEYAHRIGATPALRTNQGQVDRLPQDYADMLGWEEQAAALRRAVAALSDDERRRAVVFGSNYGEAGAAEFYGPRDGLPPVVSAAGSFWFFGLPGGERDGSVLVAIGEDSSDVARVYRDVRVVEVVRSPWSVAEEREVPIVVGRRPRQTLRELWPTLKGRN